MPARKRAISPTLRSAISTGSLLFGNHFIDAAIVRLARQVVTNLVRETNANFSRTHTGTREQSIVKTAAATEARSIAGERESRHENQIELRWRVDVCFIVNRLAELPARGFQRRWIFHRDESQLHAIDAWITNRPAQRIAPERLEIRLRCLRGEKCDRAGFAPLRRL